MYEEIPVQRIKKDNLNVIFGNMHFEIIVGVRRMLVNLNNPLNSLYQLSPERVLQP